MGADKDHWLSGRVIAYLAHHPSAQFEFGMVTSVDVDNGIVFIRFGRGDTSNGCAAIDIYMIASTHDRIAACSLVIMAHNMRLPDVIALLSGSAVSYSIVGG